LWIRNFRSASTLIVPTCIPATLTSFEPGFFRDGTGDLTVPGMTPSSLADVRGLLVWPFARPSRPGGSTGAGIYFPPFFFAAATIFAAAVVVFFADACSLPAS
jgi:hypothetical protein